MHFPPQHMEIENIYAQIHALKYRSIAITAANPGEGVTSLAIALAQRNLLSGHSTLMIDLNLYQPSLDSLLPLQSAEKPAGTLGLPQLVSNTHQEISLMGITAPNDRAAILKLRKPGVLESCLNAYQQTYDTVIIDTSPLNRYNGNNIPPERIASACDAALLVVLAGHTREAAVNQAVQRLKSTGVELAGCVINDKHNPSLKSELLRESKRLEPYAKGFAKHLQSSICGSHFLSIVD